MVELPRPQTCCERIRNKLCGPKEEEKEQEPKKKMRKKSIIESLLFFCLDLEEEKKVSHGECN